MRRESYDKIRSKASHRRQAVKHKRDLERFMRLVCRIPDEAYPHYTKMEREDA